MSGTINTFWPPAHPQTPSFVAQNSLFFIFHSVGAMICHKDTSISRLIAMGRHTTVRWYLGREWSKSSFRSNYDDSFYSLNSWDLSEGVSHLFLHCHLLCTIMSHGPGIYPDMSQAVVSTGVYSWAFFCFFSKSKLMFLWRVYTTWCMHILNQQIPGSTSVLQRKWRSMQCSAPTPGLGEPVRVRTSTVCAEIKQVRARRKTARMLMVVLVVFALCYLPISVLNVMKR